MLITFQTEKQLTSISPYIQQIDSFQIFEMQLYQIPNRMLRIKLETPLSCQQMLSGHLNLNTQDSFDPDQYQNPNQFNFKKTDSLVEQNHYQNSRFIQTDTQFVQSVSQICWQQYGLKKGEINEEQCERLHQAAVKCSQKKTINKPQLLSQDLMPEQYLTYDLVFFFFFLKLLFACGVVLSLAFSFPAMYWYGQGTRYISQPLFSCSTGYCQFIDRFSMYNQQNPDVNLWKLEWIGLGIIMAVQCVFGFAWKYNKQIRDHLKFEERCSENSMLLRGLPEGLYNQQDVMTLCQKKYLKEYQKLSNQNKMNKQQKEEEGQQKKVNNLSQQCFHNQIQLITREMHKEKENAADFVESNLRTLPQNLAQRQINIQIENESQHIAKSNHFNIHSVQIIYDFREPRKMVEDISQYSKQIWQLLDEVTENGNSVYFVKNQKQYQQKKNKIIQLFEQLTTWRLQFLQDASFRKKKALGSTLLHFKNRKDRDTCLEFLKAKYQTVWVISWGGFQPSQKSQQKQIDTDGNLSILQEYELKVGLAPEPQNILWLKVEHTYEQWSSKLAGCRIVMVLVPLGHTASLIGLQILKTYLLQSSSSYAVGLSYLVTLLTIVFNQLLWVFLEMSVAGQEQKLITAYDVYKNYAGFAGTSLSIIIAPLVVNYWFKGVYFGSNAMVGTVFEYQLTSTITIPIMNILGVDELLKMGFLKVKCLRNWWIRREFSKEQGHRLKGIYQFYSSPHFQISSTYSLLMSNFLHAAFYFMLVPAVIPLYTLQALFLYWASKVRLLRFCQFPKLIRRWLIGLIFANLLVSTLFMAGGSLLSYFAFHKTVQTLEHTPIALYLFFVWSCLFAVIALYSDKLLEKIHLFECFYPENKFESLQKWQQERGRSYPSVSTSYYVGNNSLVGLGFEKAILGTVRNKKAQELLQRFCEEQASVSYRHNNQNLKNI